MAGSPNSSEAIRTPRARMRCTGSASSGSRTLQLLGTETNDGDGVLRVSRAREQCVDERARVHRDEVLGLLTDAEELHRQAELVDDREDGTALRGPIQLRDDEAGDACVLRELASLLYGVLT